MSSDEEETHLALAREGFLVKDGEEEKHGKQKNGKGGKELRKGRKKVDDRREISSILNSECS